MNRLLFATLFSCFSATLWAQDCLDYTDSSAPTFVTPAQDYTAQCDGNGNVAEFLSWVSFSGGAIAVDNCEDLLWTWYFDEAPAEYECGPASYTVIFEVQDQMGNTASDMATFTIAEPCDCNDCPTDADEDGICDDEDPCVGAVDTCGICNGPSAIYECGCANIPAGDCDCDGNQPDAIGVCGGDCAQDLNGDGICDVVGTIGVVLVCPADYVGSDCTANTDASFTGDAVVSAVIGACDSEPVITTSYEDGPINSCGGSYFFERTFYAFVVDFCGNEGSTSCTQFIEVIDNTPPVLNCPPDMTVACDGNGNLEELDAWLASATATNDCGAFEVTNDFSGFDGGCATGSTTVTFTADNCDISTSCSATFTITGTCDCSPCETDTDNDGICDDVDPCVGSLDACGICNGPGFIYECGCANIPTGDCDCSGNQLDALGDCGGGCAADVDADGICDDIDPCVGFADACGVCNGPGAIYACGCVTIPAGDCDCNGNQLDALGVCGGNCVSDTDGDGICDVYSGCTDIGFLEYDVSATVDDGSCTYLVIPGCEDVTMDQYSYAAVQIGNRCWFAENLRTGVYADGTPIPGASADLVDWGTTTEGATTVYGGTADDCIAIGTDFDVCDPSLSIDAYGRLYNWYAVEQGNLCPAGWRVSSNADWEALASVAGEGSLDSAAEALKSTTGWADGGGTDEFGFAALPGGYFEVHPEVFGYDPIYLDAGSWGFWWASDNINPPGVPVEEKLGAMTIITPGPLQYDVFSASGGLSVRCVLEHGANGCTDAAADNYDPNAIEDDGSCVLTGCTEAEACNYNAAANVDDGSCDYSCFGCTDPDNALYDPEATTDDGSCADGCVDVSMDGYTYDVVLIGKDCWFAENLRSTVYRDGQAIPSGLDDAAWSTTTEGATTVYGEGSSACSGSCDPVQNEANWGRLYNWHAVNSPSGLCPAGWHVPSDLDWKRMELAVGLPIAEVDLSNPRGGDVAVANVLKATSDWTAGTETDAFGFAGLPGGQRTPSGGFVPTGFLGNPGGSAGLWWTSTAHSSSQGVARALFDLEPGVSRGWDPVNNGFSVRCVLDVPVMGCTDEGFIEFTGALNEDGSCEHPVDPDCTSPSMGGYTYDVVQVGDQCWLAENLRTAHYADGSAITLAQPTDSTGLAEGVVSVYGSEAGEGCVQYSPDFSACEEPLALNGYGRLYNWHATVDARGLCPVGWHVPSDAEWQTLEAELGMSEVDLVAASGDRGVSEGVGSNLKSTSGWYSSFNGVGGSGLSLQPSGVRYFSTEWTYTDAGAGGYWWSSTEDGESVAFRRALWYSNSGFYRGARSKSNGYGVRCIRGAEVANVEGCTDPLAVNFDPQANAGGVDLCLYPGCMDQGAVNYDPDAVADDGSCCFSPVLDGYTYDVVSIGNQCWFAENLQTSVYGDGSEIQASLSSSAWANTSAGATAVYGEGAGTCQLEFDGDACDEGQSLMEYGRLYNWYAINDARGLCPSGWHVPTDGEWTELQDFAISVGLSLTTGTMLKSESGWYDNGNGTDDFGFSALPGGERDGTTGDFSLAGYGGRWWSSSPIGPSGYARGLTSDNPGVTAFYPFYPRTGYSVRCLRDVDFMAAEGCADPTACNYDAAATVDDGSCTYADACGICGGPGAIYECGCANIPAGDCDCNGNQLDAIGVCGGDCVSDTDGDGVCDTDEIGGCTDDAACNYNPEATDEDGSCLTNDALGVCGGDCTADADADGLCDDVDDCVGSLDACGICNGPGAIYDCGCANIPAGDCDCNGNQLDALGDCGGDCVSDTDGDGVCDTDEIAGCTDASACNFDPTATDDDGTCFLPEAGYDCDGNCEDLNGDGVCDIELSGCTDPAACNFNPDAIEPDGSCLYVDALGVCGGDCAADADGDGVCDDLEAQPCGDPAACNFNPAADPTDTATCDYCSCPEWATTESVQLESNVPGYGLRIDLVADHDVDHPEWTALAGMRTYRLYATVPDPTSRVTAVFGSQDEAPLSVNAPAGFYQNAVGSSIASDIHSDLYDGGFPELEYDSWVTIGIDAHSDLLGSVFAEITTLAAPDENWVALFDPGSGQAGSSFAINAFIGGGWLTVPDAANCVPDSTQSVLLAQFTSAGDVDGELHFQAVTEPETDNAADVLVSVEFSTADLGTSSWVVSEDCPCEGDVDGDGLCEPADACADTTACNYDDPTNAACLYLDACGVCGGEGVPAGDCDCDGNELDALGVCGGSCAADADGDGICDDVDDCVGALDACGVCNGPGAIYECGCSDIPVGDCDCNGNQLDALGVCGGNCVADADADGICDDVDDCVGELDACGVCNGPGEIFECGCADIPAGDCDCDGNQFDALGVCGGDCAADADGDGICDNVDDCVGELDACGVCNGPGEIYECGCADIPAGDCDCDGNQLDALGVCGGDCAADADGDGICDDVDNCVGVLDACGVCNGPGEVYECGCADIPAGDCDCNGNQLDALGVCGGECAADADGDGICDDVDDCVGALDACGVCNGPGEIYECGCADIPAGDCDCDGNQLDALGVCGGDCAADADGDGICDDVDDCVGALDACGVCNGPGEVYECGCADIPAGDCDCNGNQLDALGVCGGDCAADADGDGICDDVDDCVGELDACGVCNGPGAIYECGCADIPAGDCDCDGNQLDALGVCGGDCVADTDGDGICDTDEVAGCTDDAACNFDPLATDEDGSCEELDACGVCGGPGAVLECGCSEIPEGDCDCDGTQLDALGVCGGTCAADADGDGVCDDVDDCVGQYDDCGVCNGVGEAFQCGCANIPEGDCDCDGNQLDALGVCGGSCEADANANGICDALEASLCGPGTVFDAATGQCVGTGSACPGDFDDSGLVGVSDLLIFLSLIENVCE